MTLPAWSVLAIWRPREFVGHQICALISIDRFGPPPGVVIDKLRGVIQRMLKLALGLALLPAKGQRVAQRQAVIADRIADGGRDWPGADDGLIGRYCNRRVIQQHRDLREAVVES